MQKLRLLWLVMLVVSVAVMLVGCGSSSSDDAAVNKDVVPGKAKPPNLQKGDGAPMGGAEKPATGL